jgi:hypothetical protein
VIRSSFVDLNLSLNCASYSIKEKAPSGVDLRAEIILFIFVENIQVQSFNSKAFHPTNHSSGTKKRK